MTTPQKRLVRRSHQGKIAGVCAGIADYFNLDVGLVRAITAALIFLGPTVVAVYAILWIALDDADAEPPPPPPGPPTDDVVMVPPTSSDLLDGRLTAERSQQS